MGRANGNEKCLFSGVFFETEFGTMGAAADETGLTDVYLPGEMPEGAALCDAAAASGLLRDAARQIDEYLRGKRREFDLPLAPKGTDFMQTVWDELRKIPYGETRTYAQVAAAIGRPKACRAVGLANNRNPLPIIIPCHRVIGSSGSLTGYRGGLEMKKKLLALEARFK